MRKLLAAVSAGVAVLLLAACSQAPSTTSTGSKTKSEAAPAAPAGPVSAKTAFYEMYKPARAWAPDFAVLTFASKEVSGIESADGKFGMWTAVFVSPSRNEARTYTYSVVDSGTTIHKGVSDEGGQVWSGATPTSRPFQSMEWSVDSEAAYQTAFVKAESWVKKHPGKKVAFTLASASRFATPVWYLLWGDKASGYGVVVSATTGTVVNAK